MTTDKSDRHNRLVAAFLAGLSKEGIERQIRHEYHQGHPTLTDAELDLMMAAEEKIGHPVDSLAHAKQILGLPAVTRSTSPAAAGAMAQAMKIIAAKDLIGDREMMADAIELEQRVLDAIRKGLPALPERMKFVDWDRRPAVLVGGMAFAVLAPGEDWVRVSRHDVFGTASVMSEAEWRKAFSSFAPLDLSKIPANSPRPKPTEQDFVNATLARMKADRDKKVREAALARTLKIVAGILAASANAPHREHAPPLAPL